MRNTSGPAPRVSVNIPVYNGEKTVAIAVRSILDQSFTDFELVVVNDCSKDSTPQILNEFRDPRLRVLHHERNQGISRTRNDALRASRGEFIAVLDADDIALPGRLALQVEALSRSPGLAGVFSWVELFRDDPEQVVASYLPNWHASMFREAILFENPFAHSSALLRREAMGEGYREDLSCAEDYAKWLELLYGGKRLGMVKKVLVKGWSHPPSSYSNEKMQANVRALQGAYFKQLLGRSLTPAEADAHWTLYDFKVCAPKSAAAAGTLLGATERWIAALGEASLADAEADHARLLRAARTRQYLLACESIAELGTGVLRFSGGLSLEHRLKLLIKSLRPRL